MGGHFLKVYVTQANVSSHEVNVQSCLEIATFEHELFALQPNHVYLRKSQLKNGAVLELIHAHVLLRVCHSIHVQRHQLIGVDQYFKVV